MGADNHPTVRVETDDRHTNAVRLARELRENDRVADARPSPHVEGVVRFRVRSHSMPAGVMRVLAEHGASLSDVCLETDASTQEAAAHVPR
jgi:hypothetical protein